GRREVGVALGLLEAAVPEVRLDLLRAPRLGPHSRRQGGAATVAEVVAARLLPVVSVGGGEVATNAPKDACSLERLLPTVVLDHLAVAPLLPPEGVAHLARPAARAGEDEAVAVLALAEPAREDGEPAPERRCRRREEVDRLDLLPLRRPPQAAVAHDDLGSVEVHVA